MLSVILGAMPDTDKSLLTLEQHASDAQLHATGHQHRQLRQAALDSPGSAGEGQQEP